MKASSEILTVLRSVLRYGFPSDRRPKKTKATKQEIPQVAADRQTFVRLAYVYGLVRGSPFPGLTLDLAESSNSSYWAYCHIFENGTVRLWEGLRMPHHYDGPIPPERPNGLWNWIVSSWTPIPSDSPSTSIPFVKRPTSTTLRLVLNWKSQCSLDHLPSGLTHLTVGGEFNLPLHRLPSTLTHLHCGFRFNQSLSRLPNGLTHLHLDYHFDRPINAVPDTCTHLFFSASSRFSFVIARWPSGLTHLKLPYSYSHPIDHWPPSLLSLKMGGMQKMSVDLPPTLRRLFLSGPFDRMLPTLPDGLTHLRLDDEFNQPLTTDHLPPGLTHLTVGDDFNQSVDRLPPSLTHLTLGAIFDQPVDHLPPALLSLSLGNCFDQPIENLPVTLRRLRLGGNFNHPVDALPLSLSVLVLAVFYQNNHVIGQWYHSRSFSIESARFDPKSHPIPPHVQVVSK